MTITMTGQDLKRRMEKKAILAELGATGIFHILQNVATGHLIKKDYVHKFLKNKFLQGFNPASAIVEHGNTLANGVIGGIVPEITMMGKEFKHLGSRMAEHLKKNYLTQGFAATGIEKVPKFQEVIHDLSHGNFHKVYKDSKMEHLLPIARSIRDSMPEGDKYHKIINKTLQTLDTIPDNRKESFLKELGAIYRSNPITNHLIKGVVNTKLRAVRAEDVIKENIARNNLLENVGMVNTLSPLTYADKAAGLFNAGKHIVSSDAVKNNDIARGIGDWIKNKVIVNPIKKTWDDALSNKIFVKRPSSLANSFGKNYLVGNVRDMAYDIGRLISRHRR